MIRRATPDDIPFLIETARARYTKPFAEADARKFVQHALSQPSMIVLRSERGAAVAAITKTWWDATPRCFVLYVFAQPGRGLLGDGVRLVRAIDEWRKDQGAESLHFGDDTGIDLAPIARRLGAVPDRPSYVIRGGARAKSTHTLIPSHGSTLLDRVLVSPHLLGGRAPQNAVAGW